MKGLFKTTRILAFHSFANIVRFYRACLDEGMRESRELFEEGIESRLASLGPMSKNLERSSYLSISAAETCSCMIRTSGQANLTLRQRTRG